MNVLVLASQEIVFEFNAKFSPERGWKIVDNYADLARHLDSADVVFDFFAEESPENLELYQGYNDLYVFLSIPKTSLAELQYFTGEMTCTFFGFNGLPTMLNRDKLEVSVLHKADAEKLNHICQKLDVSYHLVDDRIGMVTPRVICMIINEAYYTVQEGTASREDIDKAMKLGTNYPMGPFEWTEKLGLHNVYELLEAMYNDTHEERYKICPLLKREYLMTQA